MKRSLLAISVAALFVAAPTVALAQGVPPGQACTDANTRVAALEVTLNATAADDPAFAGIQADLVVARVDRDRLCTPPVTTVPPTTTPVPEPTTPPVTTPPTDTPPPPLGDVFNCDDFPLADGSTAQAVLDSDPTDPNQLDSDGDGVACELDELPGDDNDAPPAADGSGSGGFPLGGIATGGGPA